MTCDEKVTMVLGTDRQNSEKPYHCGGYGVRAIHASGCDRQLCRRRRHSFDACANLRDQGTSIIRGCNGGRRIDGWYGGRQHNGRRHSSGRNSNRRHQDREDCGRSSRPANELHGERNAGAMKTWVRREVGLQTPQLFIPPTTGEIMKNLPEG